MMGTRTAGLVGLNEMAGGIAGVQSEYFRVPFADVNCLVIPQGYSADDLQYLFLSDILPTAWHGCELAKVEAGDVVAIWGAGPVGILAAQCAFVRGARRVILVDKESYRLSFAKKLMNNVETVDVSAAAAGSGGEREVLELCKDEPAGAPDAIIECVGMHYTSSHMHRMEMAVGMETDSPEALNSVFIAAKKCGKVGVIGAYAGFANHVNIGTMMMKSLSIGTGVVQVQKYWKHLLDMIEKKQLKPAEIVTHQVSLSEAPKAYEIFDKKQDGVVKVVMRPTTVT
jgi:threonine dehydrogenase-like Zn-dependent dehydrogenase